MTLFIFKHIRDLRESDKVYIMQAIFSSNPDQTRGRLFAERESAFRSCFQRDRDRITHSSAFRRLKHKTQVFVEREGDYFRTRLTHSIEVSQVARTIASALSLNQELVEAISLAHDLGHTPFGHTGEDALDQCMRTFGGFDHNAQALRIVTSLEQHYALFNGLNLTWDCLEGIAKHNGPVPHPYPLALTEYNSVHDLELHTFASAEAQVAALADDIAYNNHDLHDGLRAGLFTDDQASEVPLVGAAYAEVDLLYPELCRSKRRHEALRRVFSVMVGDVITTSTALLSASCVKCAQDVRDLDYSVIQFSKPLWGELKEIRKFLFKNMYRAEPVLIQREHAALVVCQLFECFMNSPQLLPSEWRGAVLAHDSDLPRARVIGDYIAGMTDRFAQLEFDRLLKTR